MKRELMAAAVIVACSSALVAQTQWHKLSPLVRQAVSEQAEASRSPHRSQGRESSLTAFVRVSDPAVLQAEGCRIHASWGDIHIASIPLHRISALSSRSEVRRIEAGQSCHLTLDTTALVTRVSEAWQHQPHILNAGSATLDGLAGQGIIVGLMDAGFDLTHPTFYSAQDGRYRIQRFWDQLVQTDDSLAVGQTYQHDTLTIGRTYQDEDEILTKGHSADAHLLGHATHTTGIAAGSGLEAVGSPLPYPLYRGMAPEADLCLVNNYVNNCKEVIPEAERYKYTSATDALGFKYIFDYAESQGKPCVINFSEGSYEDLYESNLFETVVSQMLGPGRILCASAGNEGHKGSYLHKPIGVESDGAFLCSTSRNATYLLRASEPFEFSLTAYVSHENPTTLTFDTRLSYQYPDSIFTDTLTFDSEHYVMECVSYPSCYDSTQWVTQLNLYDPLHSRLGYTTRIALRLHNADLDIDCINCGGYFIHSDLDRTLTNYTNDHNILQPAAFADVICVGNCGYRTGYEDVTGNWQSPYSDKATDGQCSLYSSKGPTLQGQIKPDVVAPGMNVISSFSSWYLEQHMDSHTSADVRRFVHQGRTYAWSADSGTSMSSPAVAGIVALWLQVCPTLSPADVKEVLAHSCSHYDPSLSYPNNHYGHGGIDAQAGIEYIEQHFVSIRQLRSATAQPRYFTPDGREVRDPRHHRGLLIRAQ